MSMRTNFTLRDGTLYERDFHAWAEGQADALRRRDIEALDWLNLSEEIDDLGQSLRRELDSRLVVLLSHLLKVKYAQFSDPVRGWLRTVSEQQRGIAKLLRRNPSLRPQLDEMMRDAFEDAKKSAIDAFYEYEPDVDYSHLLDVRLRGDASSILDWSATHPTEFLKLVETVFEE